MDWREEETDMEKIQLRSGIYTNIFPVILPSGPVPVMKISRTRATDLRVLRDEIAKSNREVRVYAHEEWVFGYGRDARIFLSDKGFGETRISLKDIPALAARLVLDGFVALALSKGFWQRKKDSPKRVEARVEVFRPEPKGVTRQGNVKVFIGYDLRCAYYPPVESLGLVVDVVWAYQDENGTPLNTRAVQARNALYEVWGIQEEFLSGTQQLNLQIAQIRMHNYLIPFAQEFQSIPLPGGESALLKAEPFPVILGG
ncbi:hypothetical protein [Thermoflexus sp.]|uniref:hypothetical protein n=2 Tax=Thermoflexus sp. TaxID=1969742 RepID=UPI002621C462|nr:hypothetical protein [Thermoflexus sp.]MCX7689689.1 hypothetical protein [Thermoflexus sp.]